MTEIEISYTWGSDEPVLASLVKEFGKQYGVTVHLRRLDWATAWVDLFTMASQGHGSDVSIVGSTWVSTLAKLDALRPFRQEELAQIGAGDTFIAPAWQNAKVVGDERVWSIPWIGWMYVIYYHKGLLRSIGVDPARAFGAPEITRKTLALLQASSLEIPWLAADMPHPFVDFTHIAASWVWAAGGEFINPAGTKALFDRAEALSGLVDWLNMYRSVRPAYQYLSVAEIRDLFRRGHAAAGVVDINTAHTLLDKNESDLEWEDIGFSNITNTPWVGGGSYVIWEHTRVHPDREQAAVELVKFLSRKEASLRWRLDSDLMPLRMDALAESYPVGDPLHETVSFASQHGRSYYNVSHWRRVETQLSLQLGMVVKEAREHPGIDSKTILRRSLVPLASQLNIVLEK